MSRTPDMQEIGALAIQWVQADTKAKSLRKARAEIISRYGGCSRKNERGREGYSMGPCYAERDPAFEGCECCTESQPTHIAYHAAVAQAATLRRALKRAARIQSNPTPGKKEAQP